MLHAIKQQNPLSCGIIEMKDVGAQKEMRQPHREKPIEGDSTLTDETRAGPGGSHAACGDDEQAGKRWMPAVVWLSSPLNLSEMLALL